MRRGWQNGLPAVFATLVFLLVEVADMRWDIFWQYRDAFEVLSNTVMLLIAVISFFVIGLPSRINGREELSSILGCVMIPVIAIPMNIDVFGHIIRLEHILNDLWGWHLFWIMYAAVEVLVLSMLGHNLLSQITDLLRWARNVITPFGTALRDIVANGSKSILLTALIGFSVWGLYLGIQIHAKGVATVFSDSEIFRISIWLWVAVLAVSLLIHIAPQVFQKARDAVQHMDGKIVLTVIVGALFLLLNGFLPSLLQAITMIILISLVPTGLLGFIIKKLVKVDGNSLDNNGGVRRSPNQGNAQPKDLAVVLTCFVGIPLLLLCVITALSQEGKNIIEQQSLSDISTYLNFISAALEVAKSLLDLVV